MLLFVPLVVAQSSFENGTFVSASSSGATLYFSQPTILDWVYVDDNCISVSNQSIRFFCSGIYTPEQLFLLNIYGNISSNAPSGWVNHSGWLNVSFLDPYSQWLNTTIRVNNGLPIYDNSTFIDLEGNNTILVVFNFTTFLENATFYYAQDTQPPVTTSNLYEYIPYSSYNVHLNATDAHVGVNATYYELAGNGTWFEGTDFTIYLGNNTVSYYSVDQLNNSETPHVFYAYLSNATASFLSYTVNVTQDQYVFNYSNNASLSVYTSLNVTIFSPVTPIAPEAANITQMNFSYQITSQTLDNLTVNSQTEWLIQYQNIEIPTTGRILVISTAGETMPSDGVLVCLVAAILVTYAGVNYLWKRNRNV